MNISLPFLSKEIYRTSSAYNEDIRVVRNRNKLSLIVNGIQQSGPYDTQVFDRAFETFHIHALHPNHILLLGVGGGYVIKKMREYWPTISIDAVDIDETIITIALQYFELSAYRNVQYIVADASEYIKKAVSDHKHYDFILIDLFIGDDIPLFVETETFWKHLQTLSHPNGHILINYQDEDRYKERKHRLETTLADIFPHVESSAVFQKRNREYYISYGSVSTFE